ncbi:LysR substrate-binding domain-containing protein [Xanthobacteraceae bacterium Astr-EGSB]|uniref:LysR substrate-binding domain-containing protein n=1 Tax=Astrobacterium formosum TaxID=3069710 RepID=UPI0027B2DCDE|nr:LysR substrate-binding domain-containing protein [Xanthobacteraceae bacterium Astr-EGSB]
MFDLAQLRCFVTVAEELHFGRAAARLHMTQPPLSRQIQVLEHILEVALFERTSRSVRLTPAGASFLPEAKRLLRFAEEAAAVAKRTASGRSGSLKVGFTAASAHSFLPALITACRTRLPGIELFLRELVTREQVEAIETGQMDVGLVRPPVTDANLDSMRVSCESLVAALPRSHPLARNGTVSMKDFDGEAFIMYSPFESRYFYDLLVAQFAKAKILPRYVQHLSQVHSILSLVRAGLGVALVPASAENLRLKDVVLRPVRIRPSKPVELHLVWRRAHASPQLQAFLAIARDLAAGAECANPC